MARVSLQIRGTADLMGKLKRNANLNDVKRVVKANGEELLNKAQRRVPVDTGALKNSTIIRIEDNGFTAKVWSYMDYSPYVEWGTRFQYGTRYMGSSFFEQRQKFIQDMKRMMK